MYTLDIESARKADTTGASIKELGKYVGEITQAKEIKSAKTGTKGIEFSFKSQSGQKANISIYTLSAGGEKYQGYEALMAIMTCMGLRTIKPVLGKATKYDYDTKKEVQDYYANQGTELLMSTPEEFRKFQLREIERWKGMAKDIDLQLM